MVPQTPDDGSVTHLPSTSRTVSVPPMGDHTYSTSIVLDPPAGSSQDFSMSAETADLPADIRNVISHGIRGQTKKAYKNFDKYWHLFARSRSFNPYMPSVRNVLMYFHWKFHHSNITNPRSLLNVRSALKWTVNSSYHYVIDNILVSRYIAGLFNLHPLPPRPIKDIWDVNQVLAYWDAQPPSRDLPLMLLSQKTVILLLISTMRRCSDIMAMRVDNFYAQPNTLVFPLLTFPKTFSVNNNHDDMLRHILVKKFADNPQVCPLLTLQHYIHRTRAIRQSHNLFVTTQSPFKAASSMTVRRWILTGLYQAGIDIEKYSASSTRHASSSKAYLVGVSVDAVMKRAGWLNISSFVMHYNLPIRTVEDTFDGSSRHVSGQVKYPRWTPFKSLNIKTANNLRASQVLQQAKSFLFKKAVDFRSLPFVDAPSPVPRQILSSPKRVVIPSASRLPSGKIQYRKKPYVTYTTSVPKSSEHQVPQCEDSDKQQSSVE